MAIRRYSLRRLRDTLDNGAYALAASDADAAIAIAEALADAAERAAGDTAADIRADMRRRYFIAEARSFAAHMRQPPPTEPPPKWLADLRGAVTILANLRRRRAAGGSTTTDRRPIL